MKADIQILKHLGRAIEELKSAQKIADENDWDMIELFDITEKLNDQLVSWVSELDED